MAFLALFITCYLFHSDSVEQSLEHALGKKVDIQPSEEFKERYEVSASRDSLS